MASKIEVEIHDYSPEVIAALKNAIKRGLYAIGEEAVSNAQHYVTQEHRIDTGNMRRSIAHNEGDDFTAVGTDIYYAIYQEMGTSRGIKPALFLTRAAKNFGGRYTKIMKDSIEKA